MTESYWIDFRGNEISATLPINPPTATAQQRRFAFFNGRAQSYEPTKLKNARKLYHSALLRIRPQGSRPLLSGTLHLQVEFVFPPTQKAAKTIKKAGFCHKTTAPDLDNMIKVFQDELARVGIIGNDAQVAELQSRKYYAETPEDACVRFSVKQIR